MIDSFSVIFYTFSFLVPGYIIEETICSLMPMKRQYESIRLLRCLAYSVLNYVLWFSWGLKLLGKFLKYDNTLYWMIIAIAVIITGVITGLVIGFIRAKGIVYFLFNKIFGGFNVTLTHPIPAAWDYVFKNLQEGAYLTIRMDNEKFVRGRFYTKSMASSDEEYRDIYIEEAYLMNEQGDWERVNRTKGVWISPDAIRHIEFTGINDDKNDPESNTAKNAGKITITVEGADVTVNKIDKEG